jgi:hypothetical protein
MQGSEKIQDPQCVAQMRGLDFSLTQQIAVFLRPASSDSYGNRSPAFSF